MRPPLLASFCLLFCFVLRSAAADPPARSSHLRPDILYTHRGEFVQVGPMRPLTLNAHVQQFLYHPLGIEIAYVGSEPQGGDTLHFVKTIDTRTGHELSRLTMITPTDRQIGSFHLLSWSVSGKYLLLERFASDPNSPAKVAAEYLRWDLSADPPVTRTIDPEAALPAGTVPDDDENDYVSPDGHWIVFQQSLREQSADGTTKSEGYAYLLYDVEQDTFQPLALSSNDLITSWKDRNRLEFWEHKKKQVIDVITGKISPSPDILAADVPVVSKQYPDLTLDTESRELEDLKNTDGAVPACIIWVRRTAFGRMPFGAAAAGLMPLENVSSPDISDPEAVWSPTGSQIAYMAHDNLYVTDLVVPKEPMPQEKLAVGLPLDCADEQLLAVSNLKQIGLGIVQYAQDYDEKYPTAAGFEDEIYPYIKSRDLLQVAGHRFVYERPGVTLANVDAPATTENGYMDLPCARIVLMADGHVRVFPK